MNIYQRINEVRKAVPYIQKDAAVRAGQGGTYNAVTHDMVTAKLREHLIKQGILIVPTQISGQSIDGMTKNGNAKIRYEAAYEVSFINIEQPEDKIIITIHSHAEDSSDKAPGKAISYAVKYAMLKLFSLETGENDESRVELDKTVNSEQVANISRLIKETHSDEHKFLVAFNSKSLESMPASFYDKAVHMLEKKLERKEQ